MPRKNFRSLFIKKENSYGNNIFIPKCLDQNVYRCESMYHKELSKLTQQIEQFLLSDYDSSLSKEELQKLSKKFIYLEMLMFCAMNTYKKNRIPLLDICLLMSNHTVFLRNREYNDLYRKRMILLFKGYFSIESFKIDTDIYFDDIPASIRLFDLEENEKKTKFVVRNRNNLYDFNQEDLFQKIINDKHVFLFKASNYPFPSRENEADSFGFYIKKSPMISDQDGNDEIFDYPQENRIIGKHFNQWLDLTHHFPMTQHIEEILTRKKSWEHLNDIIDLKKTAEALQNEKPKSTWLSRYNDIVLESIDYTNKKFLPAKFRLDEVTHLIGLLGAGKSTVVSLIIKDITSKGKKVLILENDVQKCIKIVQELTELGVNAAYFLGNSDIENHRRTYYKNYANQYEDICSFFQKNEKEITTLDNSSYVGSLQKKEDQVIQTLNHFIKVKGNKMISPDYIDSAEIQKYLYLIEADVWIGNYNSFLQTKVPYAMDLFERDFFTLALLRSDLVIVDEYDHAQVRFDDNFITKLDLVADDGEKNQERYFLDHLFIENAKIKKTKRSNDILSHYCDRVLELQGLVQEAYPFLLKRPYIAKLLGRRTFTPKRLINEFLSSFIKIDDDEILSELEFVQKFRYLLFKSYKKDDPTDKLEKDFFEFQKALLSKDIELTSKKKKEKAYREKFTSFFLGFQEKFDLEFRKAAYVKGSHTKEFSDNMILHFQFLVFFVTFDNLVKYLYHNYVNFKLLASDKSDFNEHSIVANASNVKSFLPSPFITDIFAYSYTHKKGNPHCLSMFNYVGVGRVLLENVNRSLVNIEDYPHPALLLLSATSYSPKSTSYHSRTKPTWLLRNKRQKEMKIKTKYLPCYDDFGKLIYCSGKPDIFEKEHAVKQMIESLNKRGIFKKALDDLAQEYNDLGKSTDLDLIDQYQNGRRRILAFPVFSFEMAEIVGTTLMEKTDLKVKVQFEQGKYCKGLPIEREEYHVTKNDIESLYKDSDLDVFVFVATSIGRGINILQGEKSKKSLIGKMFFLIRPYPNPDDFNDVIHILHASMDSFLSETSNEISANEPLYMYWFAFNRRMKRLFEKLINGNIIWDRLTQDQKEQISVNMLVRVYQTIGRGLRGGTDIEVFFIDGSFAKNTGENSSIGYIEPSEDKGSGMLGVWEYWLCNSTDFLLEELYGPLKRAMSGMVLEKEKV